MDHEAANAVTQLDPVPEPASRFEMRDSAIICPALECLAWLVLIPFLDPLGFGGPLSQYFKGFF